MNLPLVPSPPSTSSALVAGAVSFTLSLTLLVGGPGPSSATAQAPAGATPRARRAERGASPAAPRSAPRPSDVLFPTPPTVERLPNGLTVVTVPWASPGIVAYDTVVRVGSRDEVEEGHSGFAHFFEHMMFRGTERHPQHDYEAALQSFGADNNAFTTSDFTCYTITAPTAALPTVVELEADRFQHLSYPEDTFRTEAGAVRGEYQVWSSRPDQPMWEALSELAFTRHTYRHTTIGYLRDIDAMPGHYEYAQQFFRRFYTPDNAFVVVVGDFDRDALMASIRQHYGGWRGRRATPVVPVEPRPTQGARRDLTGPGSTPPRLWIGWRTPAFESGATPAQREASRRETAALQLVHGLLFDVSSPLYQRLVVQEQSVLELGSWAGEHARDPGLFVVQAVLAPGRPFEPVLEAIEQEVARLARGEVPAARARAVQERLRNLYAMGLETPSSVAGLLAEMIAVGGVEALDGYLGALAAVTPEDAAAAAGRYLVPSGRFVVTLSASEGGAS